jgi:L-cysteine/cystine lyase
VTPEEARARFPVLERIAYLNAGTFGPLSRPTLDAIAEEERRAGDEGRSGPVYVERVLAMRAAVRGRLAAELGTAPELLALTDSTTTACNVVVAGLDLTPEDEVVTTDTEHFGLLGPLITAGAQIRVARVEDATGDAAVERVLAEVSERTRLVAVSHVSWITGHVLDVGRLKRASGLPLLVDGAQSVGAIPVDATVADFYTVSGQKWLCGPDSTGALFVADPERLRVARPSYFGQKSHDRLAATFEPRPDASRFDTGWIATASLAGLEAALDDLPDWRFERAAEMASRCRELLSERVDVVTQPGQATLVSFRPGGDAAKLAAHLDERGVVIRDLPGTGLLRVSCGWWTSEGDLQRLVAALSSAPP